MSPDKSPHTHDREALGVWVLGGLDKDSCRSAEAHLAICERCRKERVDLEEMTAVLDELPPEAFLDGPPDGADLLLQRTPCVRYGESRCGETCTGARGSVPPRGSSRPAR